IDLASRDAEVAQTKKRGALEEIGLEKKLKAEQDLADAKAQEQIEQAKAQVEKTRAESEATSARIRAEGEKQRIAAIAGALTPNYVRLQALDALARATAGSGAKTIVVPTTKDGLPAIYAPFLNPYGGALSDLGATPAKSTP
ncbi:MAG TPA: hypothetical protein VMV18_09540, partial [bacterium]|nr:hypothetical protein [bacterium]